MDEQITVSDNLIYLECWKSEEKQNLTLQQKSRTNQILPPPPIHFTPGKKPDPQPIY